MHDDCHIILPLRYYDAELSLAAGPEEMKWPEKGLYTLGIRLV